MTVFERLSEVGTLRALGDQESDIQFLFLIEAIILGTLSIGLGIIFSYLVVQIISNIGFSIHLPLASQALPIKIILYTRSYIEAIVVCFFSTVAASIWPARRASKLPIVLALKAKI